jgi:hypothetical protein
MRGLGVPVSKWEFGGFTGPNTIAGHRREKLSTKGKARGLGSPEKDSVSQDFARASSKPFQAP